MKKPTDSGRVGGITGAGIEGGGGMSGTRQRRLPGVMYFVVASARCSSACAFFALRSLGFVGRFGGLGLRFRLGNAGLASTLAIKMIASPVTTTESASQMRRT